MRAWKVMTGREPWVTEFFNPTQVWDAVPDWPDGDPNAFYSAPRTGETVGSESRSIDWKGVRRSVRTGPTELLTQRAEVLGIVNDSAYESFLRQGEAWWS